MKHPENQCQGKTPYYSKSECNEAAKHLNMQGGLRVKSYKCGSCNKFHFGHESKGKKLNRKDKFRNIQIDYYHVPGVHKITDKFE